MFLRSDEKAANIGCGFLSRSQKIDCSSGLAISSAMVKDLLINELHAADQPLSLAPLSSALVSTSADTLW